MGLMIVLYVIGAVVGFCLLMLLARGILGTSRLIAQMDDMQKLVQRLADKMDPEGKEKVEEKEGVEGKVIWNS